MVKLWDGYELRRSLCGYAAASSEPEDRFTDKAEIFTHKSVESQLNIS
jgi:hypothetical protein